MLLLDCKVTLFVDYLVTLLPFFQQQLKNNVQQHKSIGQALEV